MGDVLQGRSRFGLLLGLVVFLAFLLREHFVLVGIVDTPIRGDVRDYVSYAWNLVEHGVFSRAYPSEAMPTPDAFRSPGYPWLIALCMWLQPQGEDWTHLGGWYGMALQLQVLLGTASVALVGLIARSSLGPAASVLAAFLLAIWPHHVAATGALLSEVAFGFLLLLSLFAIARASRSRRLSSHVVSGIALGAAYLVNPLIGLFPFLLGAIQWRLGRRAEAATLLGVFLIPVLLLGYRNARIPESPGPGRGITNLIQGSWPQYHQSYHLAAEGDRDALATMAAIRQEIQAAAEDPRQGLSEVAQRLVENPLETFRWYAWTKPRLLWDWTIQMGAGGSFYFHQVRRSPLETSPLLKAATTVIAFVNPAFTIMALIGAFTLALFGWRRWGIPAAATGTLFCYLTLVHVILQAEPRYANAYRGIEIMVGLWVIASSWKLMRQHVARADLTHRAASDTQRHL